MGLSNSFQDAPVPLGQPLQTKAQASKAVVLQYIHPSVEENQIRPVGEGLFQRRFQDL